MDAYLDDALYPSPDVILTNSSGAYGVTIAEHLIMVTLMLLRHASAYVLEAAAHRWGPVLPMRSIMGSTITVVGTGDIGTEFARRAKSMGAKSIRGVRRTMKPADPAFDSVHTHDQLESLLPDTDLLVLALPSTPDTIGFLSRRRIALLPKTAFVINVGRGSAIDQPALVDALNAGQLAGAALDVFVQEPIPDGDPIWDAKNLLLTPHVSGQLSLAIRGIRMWPCSARIWRITPPAVLWPATSTARSAIDVHTIEEPPAVLRLRVALCSLTTHWEC